jgi:hypothetical protein
MSYIAQTGGHIKYGHTEVDASSKTDCSTNKTRLSFCRARAEWLPMSW